MDLNEIIKHFTHNIVDLNENQWKVIEVSDIEEICKEYHKQQLIIADVVVPKGTFCDYCKKPLENTCCNDCLEEMDSHNH